jgi:Zn-dependent M28 family amino/carboxypeptidase
MLAHASASALEPVDTRALVNAINATKIRSHLRAFQVIADRNDGNRALGTHGYQASAYYIRRKLSAAGYAVRYQKFTALRFEEHAPAILRRVSPSPRNFARETDFRTMTYSGRGDVAAPIVLARGIRIPPTPWPSSTSGCRAGDFPSSVAGKIVLVQRGGCSFFEKADLAARAGAVGVLIFNEGQPGRREAIWGSVDEPLPIPVLGVSHAVGRKLWELRNDGPVRVRLKVAATTTPIETLNVLADRPGSVSGRAVVVGAHLDSVRDGPGINDNGSGSATVLTIAEEIARLGIWPRNTIRFAFWGAEEEGLQGSTHYVESLTDAQFARLFVNLNFDMLGSSNYVRFVYDGDGTLGSPGADGSDVIEDVMNSYFDGRGLATEPKPLDGRSDYLAFIANGIPAGGVSAGSGGIKTPREAGIYGGDAGEPYDPCYHGDCDSIDNLNMKALNELGKAAAHAVLTFGETAQQVPSARRTGIGRRGSAVGAAAAYRGSRLVR